MVFDKTKQRLLNEFRMGKSMLSFGYTSDAINTVHGLIDLIEEVGVEGITHWWGASSWYLGAVFGKSW